MVLSRLTVLALFAMITGCKCGRAPLGRPLVELVNIANLEERISSFTMYGTGRIKIEAIGEMNIDLADVERHCLFKGDDIELFFKITDTITRKQEVREINFNYGDGKHIDGSEYLTKDNVKISAVYSNSTRTYTSLIRIPMKALSISTSANCIVDFEICIGDNDDRKKQKARLALTSLLDPFNSKSRRYQRFRLVTDSFQSSEINQSVNSSKQPSSNPNWSILKSYKIEHLVSGEVKDSVDFSAAFKTMWDRDTIYLKVDVKDSRRGFVDIERLKQETSTFHDYAWIEDRKGEVLWIMNAFYSKRCGGAIKNQRVDTILTLPAGKYFLKYRSDESHSWNNWDAPPPEAAFYGAIVSNHD